FRRALAHAIDRDALEQAVPENLLVATGGLVPPALQGHTPDIVPRFDPTLARELFDRSGVRGPIRLAALDEWRTLVAVLAAGWSSSTRPTGWPWPSRWR